MSLRSLAATVTLAALSGCDGETRATTVPDASLTRDARGAAGMDAAFVCAPPEGSVQTPQTFTGTRFDVDNGCLTGPAVTLPACGCFNGTGRDSSTWCFSAPDGATYFTGSSDGCSVEMPPGWYATQTFGPSPSGIPTAAQRAACEHLAASSTSVTTGTYDRPGPPLCPSDSGTTPPTDAAPFAYPPDAGRR